MPQKSKNISQKAHSQVGTGSGDIIFAEYEVLGQVMSPIFETKFSNAGADVPTLPKLPLALGRSFAKSDFD